jgi:hypothetical protein
MHTVKTVYKQSSIKKIQLSRSKSVFSPLYLDLNLDLDLDLKRNHPNIVKERRMKIGERVATSCGALL